MSSVATLCCFAIFMHDSVPNVPNEPRILSHTDVSATADTSDVSVIGLHPTKNNLEEYAHGQREGPVVYALVKYRLKRTGNEYHLFPLLEVFRES